MSVHEVMGTVRRRMVVAVVVALPATLLAAPGPASAVAPAAAVTKSPMPPLLTDAAGVSPISTPAYFYPDGVRVRTRKGDGEPDTRLAMSVAPGTTPVWGDWWGTGATTPAVFRNGRWDFYDTVVGFEPRPVATAVYGVKGDRPVVGDWDGDGRTDLGVVRGRAWFLSAGVDLRPGEVVRPASTVRFAFGDVGGEPVAGDWNGDGRVGIASYRSGVWRFRQTVTAGAGGTFAFGSGSRDRNRPNDRAVAGDWDGHGRDSVGLVRGATWRLRGAVTTRQARVVTRTISRRSGAVPAPWPSTAGPDGQSCPTARSSFRAPSVAIAASTVVGLATDTAADDPARDVRASLITSQRYLLGTQYERWSSLRRQPYIGVLAGARKQEYAVRRQAMAALAVAVGLSTDAYDASAIGRSRTEALRYVESLVRSLSCQHASVTPQGWGYGGQTAHWANLTAEAAWLVWDDLSVQTRGYVTSMLLTEADYQLTREPEYWRDANGDIASDRNGNSAAEEVAWNSALLGLAATVAPTAPRAGAYRAQAVELQVVAYSVPADLKSPELVNGVSLHDRLAGSNALADGTVVNHHRVHPDYMGNIQSVWWAADFAALSGTAVPESTFAHAGLVYGAFSSVEFVAGELSVSGNAYYAAPGGTIYQVGDDDPSGIYYPEGNDWGTSRWSPYMSLDAHALAYGLAPDAVWPARDALVAHTRAHRALVAESGTDDGRTYNVKPDVANVEDTYPGREEYAAQQLATAWLALYLARHTTVSVDRSHYPVPEVSRGVDRSTFDETSSSKRPSFSP